MAQSVYRDVRFLIPGDLSRFCEKPEEKLKIHGIDPCFCASMIPQNGGSGNIMVQSVHRDMSFPISGTFSGLCEKPGVFLRFHATNPCFCASELHKVLDLLFLWHTLWARRM